MAIETVQELALEKQKNVRLEQEISRLPCVIETKDSRIEKLRNELLYIRRTLFGRSSERYIKEEMRKLYFHYDEGSRAGRVAVDILKDFRGSVQSDGYGAYNIYENKWEKTPEL